MSNAYGHAKLNHECGDGLGAQTGLFRSCDEFPSSLPVSFAYNPAGAPIPTPDFTSAVGGAADAWNHPFGVGTPSPFGEVISVGGTTTRRDGKDGVNTVLWGDPADCFAPGALAVACFWYAGTSGAERHRIIETDIILNAAAVWRQATGGDQVVGMVTGNAALANPSAGWHDVQSALAHEFGHAIGLEHFGSSSIPNFGDLTDLGKHMQTMYAIDPAGSTAKRTLEVGDILGLNYVYEHVN